MLDYGNLIWVTLQRSKTAREAILMFDQLVSQYGYVSEGESFTIADPSEACNLKITLACNCCNAEGHHPLFACCAGMGP